MSCVSSTTEKIACRCYDADKQSDTNEQNAANNAAEQLKQITEKHASVDAESKEEKNIGFYAVPEDTDTLYRYLQAAMALELSTLPLYMTALYSFVADESLSATAKAAKQLVHEVFMEEMLHMNLLSNLTASIFGIDAIRTTFNIAYGADCALPADVRHDLRDIRLRPFSKQLLYDVFIQIEAPSTLLKCHQPEESENGGVRYPFEPADESFRSRTTKRSTANDSAIRVWRRRLRLLRWMARWMRSM